MQDDIFQYSRYKRPATLLEALQASYNADQLRRFAQALTISGPTRKAELAAAINLAVLGRDATSRRPEDLFARLSDIEKAAVAEALHGTNHALNEVTFQAKHGALPPGASTDRWSARGRTPSLVGLFLMPPTWGHNPRAPFVPDDLAERLRRFVAAPGPDVLGCLDAPVPLNPALDLTIVDTERSATHELFAVLRLVDMGRVQTSAQTRRPTTKGLVAVREVLIGGDFYPTEEKEHPWEQVIGSIRAFAWPLILQVAGFASNAGSKLVLTASGRRALTQPAEESLRHAWKKWEVTSVFDEFSRVEAIKGQSDRKRLTAVAERRTTVADALRECPVGKWVAIGELGRHMRATGNSFEVAVDPWRLYLCDVQYGSLGYDGGDGWSILQERYMAALLFEYAATLGLLDVAYTHPEGARQDFARLWGADNLRFLSRYDGLSCVRLNALGAFVLGLTDSYESHAPVASGRLRVLPNLAVVSSAESFPANDDGFSSADEGVLSIFCGRLGDHFVLDLSKSLAAIEKGHSASELRQFLEDASEEQMPGPARAFLEDLERRAGVLSMTGHALVIECADAETASLLATARKTRGLCTLVGDRTLIVPAASEAEFRRAVRALGYPLLSR